MKNAKVLQVVLLIAALALLFTGCSNPNSDDDDPDPDPGNGDGGSSAYVYQISWDQQLTDSDFAPGYASLVNISDTSVFGFGGAMQLQAAAAGSMLNTTDNYFGSTVNSYQFVHDGGDYGGIFVQHQSDGFDISSNNGFKIAIKGAIAAEYLEFKVEAPYETSAKVNILTYDGVTDGEWTVYSMPLGDFAGIDLTQYAGCGVWNPYSDPLGDSSGSGEYVATDITFDIAIY